MVSLLAVALAVNFAASMIVPNLFSSIAATVLFVAAVILMFVADSVTVWLLLPFILLQFSTLVSLNFIEGGSYMVEVGQAGYLSTAAVTYCLYSLLLLSVTFVSGKAIRSWHQRLQLRKTRRSPSLAITVSPLFHYAFLAVALTCVLYLLIAGLRTGFPLFTHTDRFMYRRLYADVITINILDFKVMPALSLGMATLLAPSRWLRVSYNLCFVALLLESLLFGDKFFIISLTVIVFLSPRVVQDPAAVVRRILSFVPVMIIAFGAMSVTTYFIYSDYGARSATATMERIGDRISGQGQLWFMATVDSPSVIRFDREAVEGNIVSLFQRNPADYLFQHNLAPYYFAHKYAPGDKYRAFLHSKGSVTPTMALEAYGLVLFGYVGFFIQTVICGVLLALLIAYIQSAITYGNPFLTFIPALLFEGSTKFFAQGTVYNVISLPIVKILGAFLVLDIIIRLVGLGLNRTQPRGDDLDIRVSLREHGERAISPRHAIGASRLNTAER